MKRNLGLDIARAIAILMVMTSHSQAILGKHINVSYLSVFGLLGVEIFFVLSGFLIGKMLIVEIVENPTRKGLLRFWLRRWMRTLPVYYLVLGYYIFISPTSVNSFIFPFFIFLQNYDIEHIQFFGPSWSLAIEEWFYLLVPLLLLPISLIKVSKRKVFFATCISIYLIIVTARFIYSYNVSDTWGNVRFNIFLRMDSIMTGVLLAGIKIYYQNFYNILVLLRRYILITSLILVTSIGLSYIFIYHSGENINDSLFAKTFLFNLISLSFAGFILFFESSFKINNLRGIMPKIILFISTTSYAVYLIHQYVYLKFMSLNNTTTNVFESFLVLILSLLVIFTIGCLIYKFYEKYFIELRDKFKITR